MISACLWVCTSFSLYPAQVTQTNAVLFRRVVCFNYHWLQMFWETVDLYEPLRMPFSNFHLKWTSSEKKKDPRRWNTTPFVNNAINGKFCLIKKEPVVQGLKTEKRRKEKKQKKQKETLTNVHPRRAELYKPPVQMVGFVTAYCSAKLLQRTSDKVNLSFITVKKTHMCNSQRFTRRTLGRVYCSTLVRRKINICHRKFRTDPCQIVN